MRRSLALVAASVLLSVPVLGAAAPPTFNVVIVDVNWTIYSNGEVHGLGHGNLQETPDSTWRGFVFTADCGARFPPSESRTDYFEGYWKKHGERLILLMEKVGDSKHKESKCEVKTSFREDDKVYTRPNFPHQ